MAKMGEYDHLNKMDPVRMDLSMDELADKIAYLNYGTQRFLAALVRARRRNTGGRFTIHDARGKERDLLSDGIEALLDNNFDGPF